MRENLAIQEDLAALKPVERKDGAGERGLAAPRFADQPDILTGAYLQRHAVDRAEGFGGLKQVFARPGIFAHHLIDRENRFAVHVDVCLALGHMGGCRKQGSRIVVAHLAENGVRRSGLHDLSVPHDGDLVGQIGNHRQIVGDEDHAHAILLHQIAQQVEDLRLGRHIERGGRLICNQELRSQRDCHGDRDALALATGEFVRIAVGRDLFRVETHAVHQCGRALVRLGARALVVDQDCLRNLVADRVDRIERRHRLLEDHRDVAAAHGAQCLLVHRADIISGDFDLAGPFGRARQELHDREGGERLAGARFTHDTEDLAGVDLKIDIVKDGGSGNRQRQITDGENAHARDLLIRGSCRSRRPSPSRLSPRTVSTIARPGNSAMCGASEMKVWASASMRPQEGVGGCAPRPT